MYTITDKRYAACRPGVLLTVNLKLTIFLILIISLKNKHFVKNVIRHNHQTLFGNLRPRPYMRSRDAAPYQNM